MRQTWYHSVLFRTAAVMVAAFLVLGATTVALSLEFNRLRAREVSIERLNQLIDTVESTVSVACFATDEVLASELAAGLLKNSEVLAVAILAGGKELVRRHREGAADQATGARALLRDIYSPFKADVRVGQILLTPNQAVIQESISRQLRTSLAEMAFQLISVALAMVAAVLTLVVRPIKAISDRLHSMDAARGERLHLPPGQGSSEISVLVQDVNRLADRLVTTLDEERELRIRREQDERRYHAIFDNAESGIFIISAEGILTSWNRAFARLLHVPEKIDSHEFSIYGLAWREPARLADILISCISNSCPAAADLLHRPDEGLDRWLHMVLTPISDQSIQGVVYDVTERKEAEQSAKRIAVTDVLTGAANRLGLELQLQELMHADNVEQPAQFALILVDFDDFRRVNEGFGLPIGDEVLQEAARRLRACLKSTDRIARLAADQFALGLPNLRPGQDAEMVGKRVRHTLRQHYIVSGSPLRLSLSIGIAFYPQDGGGVPQLLRHAELALDNVKARGGNDIGFFDPSLAQAAERRRRLEHDLRAAIEREQFVLHFQPIVDLRENRLVGAEALIRWQHPERGLVMPDEFIPLAEETGLIGEIGLWVLETAAMQLAAWHSQGRRLYLSLNVSGRQIPQSIPSTILNDTARRAGFATRFLALEITEGVLLSEFGGASQWLSEVRRQGFPIYLDDFGTGYSSLSYLKRFSVDRLKIDKSFVRDIGTNASDRALVEGIVAIARSLRIDVIAEGVEDAEHVRFLAAMGCRYAQGYYFSRPVSIDLFEEAIKCIPDQLEAALNPNWLSS